MPKKRSLTGRNQAGKQKKTRPTAARTKSAGPASVRHPKSRPAPLESKNKSGLKSEPPLEKQELKALRRQIRQYQKHMEMIRKISLKMTTELSLDKTLNALVETAAEFFAADVTSCMLWDEGMQNGVVRAGVGFKTNYIQQQVITAKRIKPLIESGYNYIYFEDIKLTPQGDLGLIQDEHLVSVLTVLLRFGDEVLGAINIYSRNKVRRFTQEEIENAQVFAQQAAVAVRNAYLYKAMREEAQMVKILLQVAEEMGSLESLEEVVNRLVIILERSLKFKLCVIFLWDDLKKLFLPSRAIGIPPNRTQQFQTLILRRDDLDFSEEELALRQVIRVQNAPRRFPVEKIADVLGERDLRLVALFTKGKLLGAIATAGYQGKQELSNKDEILLHGIAAEAAIAIDDAKLFSALEEAFWDIIKSLAAAIEVKDAYTHSHSESVITYAAALGERLEVPSRELELLNKASLLHDLGKIGIDDSILQKVTPLTFSERKNIERHPIIGCQILRSVKSLWDVAEIVLHHHEHYDGKGYPDRLRGEDIPLLARILALADSFDAMTSDRPYRKALTLDQATDQLRVCSGKQFDPGLVDAFLLILEQKKTKWGLAPALEVPASG